MGSTPYFHDEKSIDWDPGKTYPPERIRLNVGKRIQSKLYEKGWKQADLAEKAGIGRDSISLYIRGKNLPGASNLKSIAAALDMTIQELAPEVASATRVRTNEGPQQQMRQLDDGRWEVTVNRFVDQDTMMKIMNALNDYDKALKEERGAA